ncbi:MAG TPA: urate hydroxylase PuuD, partial [Candidatus Limnocylindria bacterium]|nr:urate hydroxylase PuuD [Candidatus Limnocylindria bacterium]
MDPVLAAYLEDWLHLAVRWIHIVAAIAWVGASFYFIALDRSLRAPVGGAAGGIGGEAWEIHGGGFYRVEKFAVAPPSLPERLQWFKWEAYLTWLSGFALLVLLYYLDPTTYLIDPAVRALEPWQAVAASLVLLVGGWIVYDQLARRLGTRQRLLAVCLAIFVALVAWACGQLFSARASYIQVGAM